jgi:hypothetical protein
MIWLWIFLGGYVAPMVFLIFVYSCIEKDSPFDEENRRRVFLPFINFTIALTMLFLFITVTLIQFEEFCEDVGKAFEKNFC